MKKRSFKDETSGGIARLGSRREISASVFPVA
jgi:hypothetical protein